MKIHKQPYIQIRKLRLHSKQAPFFLSVKFFFSLKETDQPIQKIREQSNKNNYTTKETKQKENKPTKKLYP